MAWERPVPVTGSDVQELSLPASRKRSLYPVMDVPEGVMGADQLTRRLVSDAEDTLGLPGAQGGSPAVLHSSVAVTVTLMVAVCPLSPVALISTSAWWPVRVS